jgi:hypothetical protein
MKQITFIFVLAILAIMVITCNRTTTQQNSTENLTKWARIYQVTLDSYFRQDTALNENIEFIAIDLTTLEFTNNYDKEAILIWFESYHVPVLDTNFDGLIDKGLFNGRNIPNGVVLTIDKIIESDNEIVIYGSKYRSVRGANWFRTNWLLNNGIWEFTGTVNVGIS